MHWGGKINVFHIKAGKLRSMAGNDTVYNDIGKFEGSYRVCYTPWVNDYVATNSDSSSVEVVFLGRNLHTTFVYVTSLPLFAGKS